MKNVISTIYFVLIVNTSLLAQWVQNGGPYGGYTYEIVNLESSLFVSTGGGGVYKSIDNGTSWVKKSSGLPLGENVEDLVAHNGMLYASMSRSGLYLSVNEGESWTPINSSIDDLTFYNIAVSETDIFAGNANGGIFYSSNNGDNWVEKSEGVSDIQFQDFAFFNSQIYAGGRTLFKSNNSGDTWEEVNVTGMGSNGVRSMAATQNTLYLSNDGNVFTSSDGTSWAKSNINVNSTIVNMGVSADSIYFTTHPGKLYYTKDEGLNWTLIQNQETDYTANDVILLNDKIIMSTGEGLYHSTNNGVSWFKNDDGIAALPITSFASNDSNLFVGTQYQGLYRSDLLGNWTKISLESGASDAKVIHDIKIIEDKIIIGSDDLYASSNDGNTWDLLFDPGINKSIQTLDYDNGTLVCGVNGSGVYLSIDNGETWTLADTTTLNTNTSYESIIIKDDTIVLSTHGGEIFISQDLGVSWSDISIAGSFHFTYDLKLVDGKLYAGTAKGLLVSEDLGNNWTLFNNSIMSITDIIVTGDNIYAASFQGVYAASQSNKAWRDISDDIGNIPVNELFILGDKIYIGTSSSSVWERSLSDINIQLSLDNNLTKNDFSIFPNPVKDKLNIKTDKLYNSFHINIFNLNGKRVYSDDFTSDKIQSLDVSSMTKGFYFVQVTSKNQAKTLKLLKE